MKPTLAAAVALAALAAAPARAQSGKKILFVSSYHQGYAWSDAEEAGATQALTGSGVKLDVFRLDAKRQPDDKFQNQQEQKLRALIESSKPDVVIAADDNAVQALLPYKALKWVFCGLNWDAKRYGLPAPNVTGMVEVTLPDPVLENLRKYAKGDRVGFLTADNEGQRADGGEYRRRLGTRLVAEKYVKTFAEWKDELKRLQSQADLLLLGNFQGIKGWNDAEALAWVAANARLPSGTFQEFMMPYAMLGMTKVGEEQGIWAAKAALRILKGEAPSSIPLAQNKDAKLFLNVKLASAAGVVFDPALVRNAQVLK
jgi:ABC-type glycerol-3-phosphate transport system substrate-binding protein